MKSILRKTCVVLFAGATVCASAGLAACTDEVTLESLSIVDPRTVFYIDDEFEWFVRSGGSVGMDKRVSVTVGQIFCRIGRPVPAAALGVVG